MPVEQSYRELLDDDFGELFDAGSFDAAADAQVGARIGRRRQTKRRMLTGVAGLVIAVGGLGLAGVARNADDPVNEFASAQEAEEALETEEALAAENELLAARRQERSQALGLDPRRFYDEFGSDTSILSLPVPTAAALRGPGTAPATANEGEGAITFDVSPNMSGQTSRMFDPALSYTIVGAQPNSSLWADQPDGGGLGVGPTDDNTFTDYGTNGTFDPADVPQSTFGLDVDTGSYNVADRFIRDLAQAPPPESVRVEEYINYFDYGYAQPRAALGLNIDGARVNADDNLHLVRVGVTTSRVAFDEREPVAVTFVIDVSGSMGIRERLGLVQSSLALLVLELEEDDTIAIVTYDNNGGVLLEPTPVGDGAAIVDAIERLRTGGSTNLEGGLRTGYSLATESFREDANNLVVLASDGVANVGMTGPGALANMIKEEANNGINLVTVGYGMGNYNDTLMEQLANNGDGFYAYLDDYEEAEHFFRDELSQLLVPVARDAKSQVTFDPEFVESYRLIGYENRALEAEDFRDDSVDAGELGSGHSATALYEVRLTDFAMSNDVVAGTAAVRWEDPTTGEVSEVSSAISTSVLAPSIEDASASFQLARTVAEFAQILDGNPAADAPSLEALARDAARLGDRLDDPLVRQFAALVQRAADLDLG